MKYLFFLLILFIVFDTVAQNISIKSDTIFLGNDPIGITQVSGSQKIAYFKSKDQLNTYGTMITNFPNIKRCAVDNYLFDEPLMFVYQEGEILKSDLQVGSFKYDIVNGNRAMVITIYYSEIDRDFVKYSANKEKPGQSILINYDISQGIEILADGESLFDDESEESDSEIIGDKMKLDYERLTLAGFNSKATKKIILRYNGDVNAAFEDWSKGGNSLLNRKSALAAYNLGLDKEFVESSLLKARRVRKTILAAGLAGVSVGLTQVAKSMERRCL